MRLAHSKGCEEKKCGCITCKAACITCPVLQPEANVQQYVSIHVLMCKNLASCSATHIMLHGRSHSLVSHDIASQEATCITCYVVSPNANFQHLASDKAAHVNTINVCVCQNLASREAACVILKITHALLCCITPIVKHSQSFASLASDALLC